jgi:long-chain acyl-CoA synthetase
MYNCLDDTLGAETVEFIINHSEISAIVASKVVIPNLLKVAHKCPRLKLIISMDPLVGDASNVLQQWAIDRKVTLKDWKEVEMIGRKNLRKHTPPSPETIACICYTSGTTYV